MPADPTLAEADGLAAPKPRACGTCTLCCRLPEIDEFAKPPDVACTHCTGSGCAIYEGRPQVCRDFLCRWMTDPTFSDEWRPETSHILVYDQGKQATVLVDPDYPGAWQEERARAAIDRWAKDAENEGRYLILFCGDYVEKIGATQKTGSVSA
ncbi:MAG: hypothetical protein PW791_03755 [Neorhizobium sp.]|jgi:hypothetical protein|nr:hypothetical protein [Neorhizobium sp.]